MKKKQKQHKDSFKIISETFPNTENIDTNDYESDDCVIGFEEIDHDVYFKNEKSEAKVFKHKQKLDERKVKKSNIKKECGESKTQPQICMKPNHSISITISTELRDNQTLDKRLSLHTTILTGLQNLNFNKPTQVQTKTIPAVLCERKDVLVASQTGSGKTLAFVIPIVQTLLSLFETSKLSNIEDTEQNNGLYALILTPTRELALQIVNHIQALLMSDKSNSIIRTMAIVGGMSYEKQKRCLGASSKSKLPHIVVATPGRFVELRDEYKIPHLIDLSHLRFFVCDEVDRLVANGQYPQFQTIVDYVVSAQKTKNTRKFTEKSNCLESFRCQFLLFSATLSLENSAREYVGNKKKRVKNSSNQHILVKLIKRLISSSIHPTNSEENCSENNDDKRRLPRLIDLTQNTKTSDKLGHVLIKCLSEEKDLYLFLTLKLLASNKYLETSNSSNENSSQNNTSSKSKHCLIFVNAISCLRRLVSLLEILHFKVFKLHSGMQQRQRLKNFDRFRLSNTTSMDLNLKFHSKSKLNSIQSNIPPMTVLICTDVAARGIDIPQVDFVIHYQLPRSPEIYIHRSGRTARQNRSGLAITLVSPEERQTYSKINKELKLSETQHISQQKFLASQLYSLALKRENKSIVQLAREIDELVHFKHKQDAKKRQNSEAQHALDGENTGNEFKDENSGDEMQSFKEKQSKLYLTNLRRRLDTILTSTSSNQLNTISKSVSYINEDKNGLKRSQREIRPKRFVTINPFTLDMNRLNGNIISENNENEIKEVVRPVRVKRRKRKEKAKVKRK